MVNNKKAKDTAGGNEKDKPNLSFTAHTFLEDISYSERGVTLCHVLDDMGDLYWHVKRSLFRDHISTGLKN